MIIEVDLPPDLARRLSALVDTAAASRPVRRSAVRDRIVAEALERWFGTAAVFDHDRGMRLDPERFRVAR